MKLKVMGSDGTVCFEIRDRLEHPFYWWPRTLLSYSVDFNSVKVKAEELVLVRQDTRERADFQLSEVKVDGGFLSFAQVSFFADLPSGACRVFELTVARNDFKQGISEPIVEEYREGNTIVLDTGAMKIRIPASLEENHEPPGPIMQVNRGSGWIGDSILVSPNRSILSVSTEKLESGPLLIVYRITYLFAENGMYTAEIHCASGMDFVRVKEEMIGFAKEDGIYVKSLWTGLNPTHRQALEHPAERIDEPILRTHLGIYDAANPEGELPLRLGPFEPWPQFAILTSASFWNEHTGDTLGIFIDRMDRWQDHEYAIWLSSEALLIRYYYLNGNFYWKWPLVAGSRSIGLACYGHQRDVESTEELEALCNQAAEYKFEDGGQYSANIRPILHSRTTFLRIRYGVIDLDVVKDWILEYPNTSRRPPVIFSSGECSSPDELEREVYDNHLVKLLPIHGTSAVASRSVYHWFTDGYNRHYPGMSEGQKKRLTAMYLFLAYHHAGEEYMPMKNMLSGHPNFLADVKCVPAYMAFLFPEHPKAGEWCDLFEKFLELNTRYHTRPHVRRWQAKGGRWTENLGVYVWAFLRPSIRAAYLLKEHADGRNRLASEPFAWIGSWLVDALSSPFEGELMKYFAKPEFHGIDGRLHPFYWGIVRREDGPRRVHVPQGAHASRRMPPRTQWLLGQYLLRYSPLTAEHLMWAAKPLDDDMEHRKDEADAWRVMYEGKNDNRGTNPHLRSCKYTGYGITLRSAVDTPDEMFVHLQQLDAGPNYRWGISGEYGSGNLYFYARGRAYSHNAWEDAGDRYTHDTDFTCNFGVWKRGAFRTIGTNVLNRPLHHLVMAQFAEILPRKGPYAYSWPEYGGRSVTLVGSDYFVLYDKVFDDTIAHRFSWFVRKGDRFPFIHFVKGGLQKTAVQTFETKGVWYDGTGDCMAVITHKPGVRVRKTGFGCVVSLPGKTDFVFGGREEVCWQEEGVRFKGFNGLARKSVKDGCELALFHGEVIGADGVTMRIEGSEASVGVSYRNPSELSGKYRTKDGGILTLEFDGGLEELGCFFTDGEKMETEKQRDSLKVVLLPGEHNWQLTCGLPKPMAPLILRTENSSAKTKVYFTPVSGTEAYRIETSGDNGLTWKKAGDTTEAEYELTELNNGTKIHVRVIAYNERHESLPADEYPVYVTDQPPQPPDGLRVRISEGKAALSWGEVLGVMGYRVYLKRNGEETFETIYSGMNREFIDVRPDILCEYAVSAVNGNGEGSMSITVDTDPESWLHWDPKPNDTFRRRYTDIYHGKPNSVFEYGIKPFTESGYKTKVLGSEDTSLLTDEEDGSIFYPK